MDLFKNKTTDEKFQEDKKRKVVLTLLRVYRDDKFKIPRTEAGDKLIEICNKIDPDHKMPEEVLVATLIASDEVREFLKLLDNGTVLPDDAIKAIAEKYYQSMLGILQSPDSGAWDTYEFQSQQLITVLSMKYFDTFKKYLKETMESDPKCPWFMKTKMLDFMSATKNLPTPEDEETAEEIMSMVCVGLKKSSPEVYRALVDSLKWRGKDDLQRTLEAVKKTPPEKRKLRGRESCVFIEAAESVHYVG